MQIKGFKRLSALRLSELQKLAEEACEVDGIAYSVFSEPFLNYTREVPAFFFATVGKRTVGALSLFLPGDGTAEISALVAPKERRKGVFTGLLNVAKASIKALKIKKVLIVSNPGIDACERCLKSLSAKHYNSEYKMTLEAGRSKTQRDKKTQENKDSLSVKDAKDTLCGVSLFPATQKDIPALSPLLGDFFDTDPESAGSWLSTVMESDKTFFFKFVKDGRIIGCGGFVESFKSASVFGVGIEKEFRGQGLGRLLMTELLRQIPSGYSVVLQVSDKNAAAMSLYQKLGFAVTATTRYHTLKI